MKRVTTAGVAAVLALTAISCIRVERPSLEPNASVPESALWERPSNLAGRDVFYGPWGREHAPDPNATYTFVERKHTASTSA